MVLVVMVVVVVVVWVDVEVDAVVVKPLLCLIDAKRGVLVSLLYENDGVVGGETDGGIGVGRELVGSELKE